MILGLKNKSCSSVNMGKYFVQVIKQLKYTYLFYKQLYFWGPIKVAYFFCNLPRVAYKKIRVIKFWNVFLIYNQRFFEVLMGKVQYRKKVTKQYQNNFCPYNLIVMWVFEDDIHWDQFLNQITFSCKYDRMNPMWTYL